MRIGYTRDMKDNRNYYSEYILEQMKEESDGRDGQTV